MTTSTREILDRNQVDNHDKWDDQNIFPDTQAWQEEYDSIKSDLDEIRTRGNRLSSGPVELTDSLEFIFNLRNRIARVGVYAALYFAVDKTDQAAYRRVSQFQNLVGQYEAAISFLEPGLLEIGQDQLADWMSEESRLEVYRHYFETIDRKRPHLRSPEIEEILGLLSEPFGSVAITFGLLTDADFQFSRIQASDGHELPITQGTIDKFLANKDREVRRNAWESYLDTYLDHKNTLTSNLSTSVRQNVFEMRARNHKSTLAMALFEDNIPLDVYANLLDEFKRNLNIWHRYWSVRKRVLGLDQLRTYDIWAPLQGNPTTIPYKQAVEWIAEALMPLGDEYSQTIKRGCLEERWVDVYPNKGKTAGAFSSGTQGTHPFIVMNYAGDAVSLGALAHELGHSMHSYLSWNYQPPIYADYSLFAAEVASNFHQAMLRAYLFSSNVSEAVLIGVLEEAMANFHRYFLVMPNLANFELEIHQQIERGEGLTADGLIQLHADLLAASYGDEMVVDPQRDGISWATFGHLYHDYYVYQYVTGIAGANHLANRIFSGEENAVEDYLTFLKAGSSMYPIDALKIAGVDLSKPDAIKACFKVLSELIDKLEELV